MTGRKQNYVMNREGFGCPIKKPGMQNLNRNRMVGGKSATFAGSLMNQVNPWLPQNNTATFSNLGRSIGADPQAQLALASNLLNNLLAPSTQQNKFAQPPSLLSLGTSSNSSFNHSSFSVDRFGIPRSNLGRIQKRDNFQSFGKNKRFGDRKNQKKDQIIKKVTDQKNAEKKDVSKKEEGKLDKTNVVQSVSDESERKAANDQPVDNVEKKDESKKPVAAEPKVSYSEIPPALLFCHICRKHMWDESSFEKHLEGRPHKTMVEELDRTYKLKVALLRHEARVMEQQREIDIKRAHRKGSKVKMQQRGSCTMCDLSFYGTLPAHRKNERHQRLKKFLHPKCNTCNKEFYTRLEWDDHKLTTSHLKKLAEKRDPNLDLIEFDIIDFIDDVNEELEAVLMDIKVCGKRESLGELIKDPTISQIEAKEEKNVEDEKEIAIDENGDIMKEEKLENGKEEQCDDEDVDIKLPKYVPGIPIGLNFVVEKSGFLCRACNRFVLSSEESRTHCQSLIHYNNTIRFLKIQNKIVFSKKRSNDVKNDDEVKLNEVGEVGEAGPAIQANEFANKNEVKRRKLDDAETASVNGSISGGSPVEADPSSPKGTEKSDSEHPLIAVEKNFENVVSKREQVLEDVKKEVIAEVLKAVKVSPEILNEEKKNTTPYSRPQRTRRTRQN